MAAWMPCRGGAEARHRCRGHRARRRRELIDTLRRENEELRRRIAELEAPAPDYDRLTGLARREVLVDRLDHCMLRSARTSEQFAVLYCDLDGFKLVNDVFGHEAGDAVLTEVAEPAAAVSCVPTTPSRASAATSS